MCYMFSDFKETDQLNTSKITRKVPLDHVSSNAQKQGDKRCAQAN